MRLFFPVLYLFISTPVSSQVYQEPDWMPPLPPPVEEYCGDLEKVSEPVVSYRISQVCEITDVKALGEYQYGMTQLKQEVEAMTSKEMVRRLVSGRPVLFNQVSIELHRASERTATLVCTVDMMGKQVIDARILRQRTIGENGLIPYEEPVPVENNQLPNLGVFTYTRQIEYTTNNCPE